MTSDDRWQRTRDLFERALDEAPADLDGWLSRQEADESLRNEVRSLMGYHSRAGSFLVEPVAHRLPDLMSEDRPLEPGQVIGPYSIVREIGRGGMGRVYLASDHRLGRQVALKAISPGLTADASHRDRLRREARAAGALTHPGICTIYALEEIDGALFIAAEFIDGGTLREEMDGTPRPAPTEVLRTARDLADALAAAHRQGITHRDLKPENVMRTSDGRLKILDFGLARFDTPDAAPPAAHGAAGPGAAGPLEARVTQPGAIVGTPAYMAPEQLNGRAVDARADVFALGVLLYEYASGVHPFAAETSLAVVARILESEAASLARWRDDLPSSLVDVLERCCRKAPDERFASAADIVRALDRVDHAHAVSRVPVWWRTHQAAAITLYFAACVLAWQIHDWRPGVTTAIFVVTCIAATVGGIFRGHLLFTEGVTGARLAAERQRATPVTLATDLLIALALGADGTIVVALSPVAGVLTIALGVGIALTRLLLEPATTAATFEL